MINLQVEVRKREGQALNIHMFCARRPGLLLSTVRALDALGLDVQQAVISCFNGFALDLFRAEVRLCMPHSTLVYLTFLCNFHSSSLPLTMIYKTHLYSDLQGTVLCFKNTPLTIRTSQLVEGDI
jgi:hypothetical protein